MYMAKDVPGYKSFQQSEINYIPKVVADQELQAGELAQPGTF